MSLQLTRLFVLLLLIFIWLPLSQLQHVGSSSLTRDQTQTSCFGSTYSQPLDHQGNPLTLVVKNKQNFPMLSYICLNCKQCVCVCVCVKCSVPCDPMNWSLSGSSVPRILQGEFSKEWVAIPFSRRSSQPRDQPRSPGLQADSLPSEPLVKPNCK